MNCTSISSVSIGKSVESISESAFENCTSLEHITFRGKTKTIDSRAFRETGLKSLNLPDGLETIGNNAFYGIETLSGVLVIPESVTKIGEHAFWTGKNAGNEVSANISGIRVDSSAISISKGAFKATGADYIDLTRVDDLLFWGDWVLDENENCIIYAKSNGVLNKVTGSQHAAKNIYALTSGGIFAENTAFSEATLATPIQDGYKFEGWYESENFSGSAVTDASVGKTYYAKWTEDKDDSIYGQSKNVDLGIIAEGGSTSATVGFTGTIALDRAESDHNYFTADISGMTVTVAPADGLKPGTYKDTIYVYTETGATHFIYITLTVTEKSADADQPQGDLPFWLPAAIGSNPFSDVAGGAYYNEAVRWAVKNGIASGTDAKHFSPDAACTRGQAVTFLWRAAGCPAPALAENPFADVKPTDYCYDAVLWAVQTGVAKGTSASTFSPDAACTRGQIVTFLYRAAGSPSGYANSGYTDVPETSYCAAPVAWAVALRVTSGTSAITFSPDALCTRAQIVTFLYRANA